MHISLRSSIEVGCRRENMEIKRAYNMQYDRARGTYTSHWRLCLSVSSTV